MTLNEILYIIAYCLFLIGAAKSFRDNGSPRAIWIMTTGVVLDFLVSMLPMLGVSILKMDIAGSNAAIIAGITLGFLVWLLFIIALLVRKTERTKAFHVLIAATEILWFIDFITFLYGLYKFPLT